MADTPARASDRRVAARTQQRADEANEALAPKRKRRGPAEDKAASPSETKSDS